MIRINKVSEYGVLALGFIGGHDKALSAREISDGLHIPYEITAKTLQRLKESGFIQSHMGTHGGYKLNGALSEISLVQVIDALEGPVALVECADHSGVAKECSMTGSCGLKVSMNRINQKIRNVLESLKLDELILEGGSSSNDPRTINDAQTTNDTQTIKKDEAVKSYG